MASLFNSFSFTLIFLSYLAFTTVSTTNVANLQDQNPFRNFPNHLNTISESQQKWLLKEVIPIYIREFMDLHLNNQTSDKLLQSEIFEDVTWDCKIQVLDWLARLNIAHWGDIIKEEQKWVLQMIDAWGKIPEGILSGHVNSFGDYDQCVQTQADVKEVVHPDAKTGYSFSGMYCSVYLLPLEPETAMSSKEAKIATRSTEVGINGAVSLEELIGMIINQPTALPIVPTIGTCFPNTCTQNDVYVMVNNLLYSQLPNPPFYLWPMSCADRHKPDFDTATYCVITLLGIIAGLTLVAGCIDYLQRHYKPDSNIKTLKAYKYLMAFSFYTNTKKLMSTHRGSEDLSCLHGIRFLSTAWVVLGHTYDTFTLQPHWNLVDISRIFHKWTEMAVINATFSVDTFFLMTGMLATYSILRMLDKTKGKFNIVMFYVHRYIRLTPCYAILIGIQATLFKYTLSGPHAFYLEEEEGRCRRNWWTNLLYINNLYHSGEQCNAISWYLANDMQFFVVSPLIVYPMWKWETMGTVLTVIYTILSCIAPVLVTRYADGALPAPALTRPGSYGPGFIEIYQRPWSRISTFLVGVWLGWIIYKSRGHKITLKRPIVLLLWLVSTGTVLAVLFGTKPWFDPANDIPKVGGYFYAGLGRFSFAVGVAWVIFACLKGYGGIVNEFLSWKPFMPLGRLCFSVYLVSFHLQDIFHTRLTIPIKMDTYTVVNLYFAHLVMSYFVAFLCTILFESPFMILQKLLFDKATSKLREQPTNNVAVKPTNEEQNNNQKQI